MGTNDDKILATCLSLCKNNTQMSVDSPQVDGIYFIVVMMCTECCVFIILFLFVGEPRKIYRDVVLLTEDRNLRVKALSSDMPVRALMDFINWLSFNNS